VGVIKHTFILSMTDLLKRVPCALKGMGGSVSTEHVMHNYFLVVI